MTDQENKESVNKLEVAEPASQVSASPSETQAQLSDKELNFKRLRESNEELKRQIEELRTNFSKSAAPAQTDRADDLDSLSGDDILTKSQNERLAEKKAKEIIEKVLVEHEKRSLPEKVRSKYSDFDAVVTNETIAEFEKNEPALAQACAASPNPFEATYKMLKLLNTNKAKPAVKEEPKEEPKIPLSSNAFTKKGGLGSANVFGSMSKDDVYKEMMDYARRA